MPFIRTFSCENNKKREITLHTKLYFTVPIAYVRVLISTNNSSVIYRLYFQNSVFMKPGQKTKQVLYI